MDDMEFGVVDQRTYLSIHQNEIHIKRSFWLMLFRFAGTAVFIY